MGSLYGQKSRLFLNNDVSFLAAILNGFSKEIDHAQAYWEKSCWNLPEKSAIPIVFRYVSAINVFLASIKIKDNIIDSRDLKKLNWKTLGLLYGNAFRKSRIELISFGFPMKKVEDWIELNFQNEHKLNLSLLSYTHPTSQITKTVFEFGGNLINLPQSEIAKLKIIGKSLGEIVYCADAKYDLEQDMLNNNFNPLRMNGSINQKDIDENIQLNVNRLMESFSSLNISTIIKTRYLAMLEKLRSTDLKKDPKEKDEKKENSSSYWDECCICDECCDCCQCCFDS